MKKGIIVSCQAEEGSAFNNVESIIAFAKEAERGGAVAIRIEGYENIMEVKRKISIPVIGLIKRKYTNGKVWITSCLQDAILVEQAGADYIAVDATGRKDPIHALDGWEQLKEICTHTNLPVIGDMASTGFMDENIKKAEECGCDILSTTLSGYTEDCVDQEEPDFKFLNALVDRSNLPIIAEGRYYQDKHITLAKTLGANNIVIGTAITRPHLITKRYNEKFNEIQS